MFQSLTFTSQANGIDPSTNETVQFRISDQAYADALSQLVLEPLAEEGIDFWWTDWQQGEDVGVPDCYGLSPTCMYPYVILPLN